MTFVSEMAFDSTPIPTPISFGCGYAGTGLALAFRLILEISMQRSLSAIFFCFIISNSAIAQDRDSIRGTFIESTNGDPLLIDAAVAAVREWKYSPMLMYGYPVRAMGTVTVVFNLR